MMRPAPFVRGPAAWAQLSRPRASVSSIRAPPGRYPAAGVRCASSILSGHIQVGENEGILYVNSMF